MKKATREFIRWCKNPKICKLQVGSLEVDGAQPNRCFDNVMRFLDKNELWYIHSGWLVGDFFGAKGTAIIPHFWVKNKADEHFDITPRNITDLQKYDYISDFNIALNVSTTASVPVPLRFTSDRKFHALRNDGVFELVEKIDYEYLFLLAER